MQTTATLVAEGTLIATLMMKGIACHAFAMWNVQCGYGELDIERDYFRVVEMPAKLT